MRPNAPEFKSMDEARAYVRERMPDETHTVIDNVAWSLLKAQS